jgi:tetratricopeptide (TPR) repeat protein
MKRGCLLSILFTCLTISFLQAQPLRESSYETMIETAEEQYALKDYYRALEWYEKAYDESGDRELIPYIAEMHYRLRDYNRAENWYSRLLRRDKNNKWGEVRFEYARTLKMNGKYDEAIIEFQQFVAETEDPVKKELAQAELTGCAENIIPGETGIVVKADCVQSIFSAMASLTADPQRRLEMGRAARHYMEKRSFNAAFNETWRCMVLPVQESRSWTNTDTATNPFLIFIHVVHIPHSPHTEQYFRYLLFFSSSRFSKFCMMMAIL